MCIINCYSSYKFRYFFPIGFRFFKKKYRKIEQEHNTHIHQYLSSSFHSKKWTDIRQYSWEKRTNKKTNTPTHKDDKMEGIKPIFFSNTEGKKKNSNPRKNKKQLKETHIHGHKKYRN